MKIRHIYWFAYYNDDEPSVRYRAKYPLASLYKEHDISYSIVYPGYSFRRICYFVLIYLEVLFFRKKDSVLVFQKLYTSGIYTYALKWLLFFRPQQTLYDIDDAEHTRYPTHNIHYFMRRCTYCTAGSQALIDYILPFNTRVFLLTSPVIDHGCCRTDKAQEAFNIGWIGYYGAHQKSLNYLFFPALIELDLPIHLLLLGVASESEQLEIINYFAGKPNIQLEMPLGIDWHDEEKVYQKISSWILALRLCWIRNSIAQNQLLN